MLGEFHEQRTGGRIGVGRCGGIIGGEGIGTLHHGGGGAISGQYTGTGGRGDHIGGKNGGKVATGGFQKTEALVEVVMTKLKISVNNTVNR